MRQILLKLIKVSALLALQILVCLINWTILRENSLSIDKCVFFHLPENDMENKNSFALEPIKFRTYDISHAASPKIHQLPSGRSPCLKSCSMNRIEWWRLKSMPRFWKVSKIPSLVFLQPSMSIFHLCRLSVTRFNNCAVEEAQYRWACKVLQRFSPHLENFMGAILWSTPLPIISVLNMR